MREQKFGKIINVSSIGSEMGLPFRGFYSASKSALDKVVEAMRYEVYQWNVEVCSLHLGDIKPKSQKKRGKTQVSEPYKNVFDKVYSLMNAHVDEGTRTLESGTLHRKIIRKNLGKHIIISESSGKNWCSFEMDSSSENL